MTVPGCVVMCNSINTPPPSYRVDPSCSIVGVLNFRYKQQIAEMEAAMRSTWEEKSKQSESSERERQRLQQQAREIASGGK